MERIIPGIYGLGVTATMIYLTFLNGYIYTSWNWIVALPVNMFLSGIWPIYWAALHWIM